MRIRWLALGVVLAACGGVEEPDGSDLIGTSSFGETSTSGDRMADFNGDGYGDLAVGVPEEDYDLAMFYPPVTRTNAGIVHVFYGSAGGLTAAGAQRLTASWASGTLFGGASEERFGSAVAWGDFDGDGYSDLAIGAPGASASTGAVHVLYGSAGGITTEGGKVFTQANMGREDDPGDFFGAALAAGDFDGNGNDDLAIGAPGHFARHSSGSWTAEQGGVVYTLSGFSNGLIGAGNLMYQLGDGYIDRIPHQGDYFGFSLATADFDGDANDELAIGVPGRASYPSYNQGAVVVLDFFGTQIVGGVDYLTVSSISGQSMASNDRFGYALATGDFNGGGLADLAVGAPGKRTVGVFMAIAGSFTNATAWTQDSAGILGTSASGDAFGSSLVSADFDDDGKDDLAIGARNDDEAGATDAGAVNVIRGGTGGLTSIGDQLIHQGITAGVPDAGDKLGHTLIAGDFDGNGVADLALTIPNEDCGSAVDAGQMLVLLGQAQFGLYLYSNSFWHQDSAPAVPDVCETGDHFGRQHVYPISLDF